jgi:RNA polymerase sigma factor (sigma-70 family)
MNDATSPIVRFIRGSMEDDRYKSFTDGQLLGRFLAERDEGAFRVLVSRHGSMVLDVCRNIVASEADAEDGFQATFLVLAQKAEAIRKHTSVASWLYGVAHRIALKTHRDYGRRQTHEARVQTRGHSDAPDELSWYEVKNVIYEELNKIAECYRSPLVLCYLEGKTQDEAAMLLDVSIATVKKRLERGRAILRVRLERRNLGPVALLAVAALPAASSAVPASLVCSTVKSGIAMTTGIGADSALPANVAALTKGAKKTMLMSKTKAAIVLGLMLSACIGATVATQPMGTGQDEPAQKSEAANAQREAKGKAISPNATLPDLTRIDRTLVKEPKYTNQPYYALLVFGPEAKKRVWLVVDGDTLYVDRNSNGDLTEANKRIQNPKKVEVAPGMYKWMDSYDIGEVEGVRLRWNFWVRDKDYVAGDDFEKYVQKDHQENGLEYSTLWRVDANGNEIGEQVPLCFCQRARDAQICHVAGPLTFFLMRGERWNSGVLPLARRDNNLFSVTVGTPGLPTKSHSDPVFVPLDGSKLPENAHAIAQFEFPHKDPKQPPIKIEVVLNQRAGPRFDGLVKVPTEAGGDKAKVTLSFPSWKEGKVIPATFEVPIVEGPIVTRIPPVRKHND